jgi:hypothetical protein
MDSNQSVPNVFGAGAGADLKSADLDNYVDPTVTGVDRQNVTALMALVPQNLRGDMVYLDDSGHLVGNNVAVLPTIRTSINVPPKHAAVNTARPQATGGQAAPMSGGVCGPPASGTGPYIRDNSVCGMTTGWGFVQVPCGYTNFASGDQGNLYFELTGSGGASASVSEGGLQYNNDQSIQPYVTASTSTYPTMSGGPYKFNCSNGVMIITHGATYCTGCSPAGEYIYTSVGLLPSNIQPETQWVNMNSQFFYPDDQEWYWLKAPSDISGAGTDAAGNPTPCTGCTITKLTTIAQSSNNINNSIINPCYGSGYACDGSYFGTDGLSNYINWMEVGFGQYATTCNGLGGYSNPCEIEASNNPNVYFGGPEYFPDSVISESSMNPAGYGPYETYDGIYTGTQPESLGGYKTRRAGGSFNEPTPPPATPTPVPSPRPTKTPGGPNCSKDPSLCAIVIKP